MGRPPENEPQRRAALWLMRQGVLDMSEIADVLGVSRQLVRYWGTSADIDYQAARLAFKEAHRAKWHKVAMARARR